MLSLQRSLYLDIGMNSIAPFEASNQKNAQGGRFQVLYKLETTSLGKHLLRSAYSEHASFEHWEHVSTGKIH